MHNFVCNLKDSNFCPSPNDVYIGRPSQYGNPFSHQFGTLAQFETSSREEAVNKHEVWLSQQPKLLEQVCRELPGKRLICFCSPLLCHGEVLARIANGEQLCLPIPNEVL